MTPIQPFFKWAGGKRKMIKNYAPLFPTQHSHYVEPFVGAGAVLCHMANEFPQYQTFSINDKNTELVGLYQSLQGSDIQDFLDRVLQLSTIWASTPPEDRKQIFYEVWRPQYWDTQDPALLFALMKTCFNGMWKTMKESNGLFATALGSAVLNQFKYTEENLLGWNKVFERTTITADSYEKVFVPENSFVFCDPPYREVKGKIDFVYGNRFDDAALLGLIEWARTKTLETGSTVWISNTDIGDGFFEKHAPDTAIERFDYSYTSGRGVEGKTRAASTELLIRFSPDK